MIERIDVAKIMFLHAHHVADLDEHPDAFRVLRRDQSHAPQRRDEQRAEQDDRDEQRRTGAAGHATGSAHYFWPSTARARSSCVAAFLLMVASSATFAPRGDTRRYPDISWCSAEQTSVQKNG